jgi:hypothetical protein
MRLALLLSFGLGGCLITPQFLDRSALNHEDKGDRFAEKGDGWGAARQRQIAANRREQADVRANKTTIWVQSEWRME